MKQLIIGVVTLVVWGVTTWLWVPVMTELLAPLNWVIHFIGALMFGALIGLFSLPYLFGQQRFKPWKAMTLLIIVGAAIMMILAEL